MANSREEALFALALAKSAGERTAFLDSACLGDKGLRARLDALLAAHEQGSGLLPNADTFDELATAFDTATPTLFDGSSRGGLAEAALTEAPGSVIGRFTLVEKLGEGGFGAVWAADQKEPVKRRVALKIIKLGMDTRQVIARFEAERQALAVMDHPGIAKVLDAGTTDSGRFFFVMELVKGVPITRYCDQGKLSTQERLNLFIKVCQAVQHAHQKGIIHRDIKPGNILVTEHDGEPVSQGD